MKELKSQYYTALWHTHNYKNTRSACRMINSYKFLGLSVITVFLAACQTTPRQYNGSTGYQIENKSENSATIAYTLSARANQRLDEDKLQRACQKVLNPTQTYKISVLSINEIANPKANQHDSESLRLGQSRTSFGLSNTQSTGSSEDYATRLALESRPTTLQVVRYTCS